MKLSKYISVLVLFVITVVTANAAKHPVPLDPKADASVCLQCHDEKAKAPHVHSAMQAGCTACHEIRVTKDVTRVKLITTNPTALCLTCHDNKHTNAGDAVHPPAVRDCVKCHDPHSSPNENQLVKASSGTTKEENLCLNCHNEGTQTPKDGSRHAALDMGCSTCHVTHKSGERGKQEFDYHLTKATPALCLDCHDAKDASLQKAHQGQPFASANCVQCHNPHQSKSPKLMQAYTHAPFEGKMCDSCHQPAKDGKVSLVNTDTRALCLTCHSEVGGQMEKMKVQHPGAMGECVSCHNPHAGKTPRFIQPDPVRACLACHSDQSDQMKKAHLHQPAFQQSCAICHEAHGGDNDHLLRKAKVNDLCLECHGPDSTPKKLDADHVVTIFDGKVILPENYFAKVPVLPIKYGHGHPVDHHPVTDVVDPANLNKIVKKVDCLSCHQPHSSKNGGLLAQDQANNAAFCTKCHNSL